MLKTIEGILFKIKILFNATILYNFPKALIHFEEYIEEKLIAIKIHS